ncbi:MAG: hypothetical protein IJQ33_00765 [Clostridia bacterium]|nr:hypothetical protein [Clostridia bacterium]MBR0217723.1 hypothetical protein [Clostridia bacterium]
MIHETPATEAQSPAARQPAKEKNENETILTKSLTGILHKHDETDAAREEALRRKYEISD